MYCYWDFIHLKYTMCRKKLQNKADILNIWNFKKTPQSMTCSFKRDIWNLLGFCIGKTYLFQVYISQLLMTGSN